MRGSLSAAAATGSEKVNGAAGSGSTCPGAGLLCATQEIRSEEASPSPPAGPAEAAGAACARLWLCLAGAHLAEHRYHAECTAPVGH